MGNANPTLGDWHLRASGNHRHTTVPEHKPSSRRCYADWTVERIRREAKVPPSRTARCRLVAGGSRIRTIGPAKAPGALVLSFSFMPTSPLARMNRHDPSSKTLRSRGRRTPTCWPRRSGQARALAAVAANRDQRRSTVLGQCRPASLSDRESRSRPCPFGNARVSALHGSLLVESCGFAHWTQTIDHRFYRAWGYSARKSLGHFLARSQYEWGRGPPIGTAVRIEPCDDLVQATAEAFGWNRDPHPDRTDEPARCAFRR
jgi:hypothetical protein